MGDNYLFWSWAAFRVAASPGWEACGPVKVFRANRGWSTVMDENPSTLKAVTRELALAARRFFCG